MEVLWVENLGDGSEGEGTSCIGEGLSSIPAPASLECAG